MKLTEIKKSLFFKVLLFFITASILAFSTTYISDTEINTTSINLANLSVSNDLNCTGCVNTEDIADSSITTDKIATVEKYIFLPSTIFALDGASWKFQNKTPLIEFPDNQDSSAYVIYAIPDDYISDSTKKIELIWTSDVTSGNADISILGSHIKNGDLLYDYEWITSYTITAPSTSWNIKEEPINTIIGSSDQWFWEGYRHVVLKLVRHGTSSSDTLSGSIYVVGIKLYYNGYP